MKLIGFDKLENKNQSRFDRVILGTVELAYTKVFAGTVIEKERVRPGIDSPKQSI